ncbi:MAG: 16S rRNA (adenine(1518)-N(6)/adenine(1519)-N(6))-dimethyltransferase RsmA [Planctomycetota bacterium]
MKDVQRQTRSFLMSLFTQHGINPRGDLGQNFLIDVNLIEYVVRAAELGPRDVALEVGSGTGGMTAFLARDAGRVISVDIDRNMSALAAEAVQGCANVTLINNDILKNKNTLDPKICDVIRHHVASIPEGRLKLVANLPYSVATPVISNLIASDLPWERMICTIQWELAEKMVAEPGDSKYGAMSVWIQSQASVRILKKLGPNVFWPRPKVDSAIVSIWRDQEAADRIHDRRFFQDFLRRAFTLRRKFIRSVLVALYRKELDKAEIDVLLSELGHTNEDRAENMDVPTLIRLSNHVLATIRKKGADVEISNEDNESEP